MKKKCLICAISIVIFFFSWASYSLESSSEEMQLTLSECIEYALKNNLDVAAQKINPEISKLNYQIAQTLFDPILSANTSTATQKSAPVSFISITKREEDNYSVSLDGNIVTGGSYSVSLGADRSYLTAGFFVGLNPNYSSGLSFNFRQPLLRNFGREATTYNILVSKNNYDISNAQFRLIVTETVRAAEQAYWNLLGVIKVLDVQTESLKLAEEQLERNKIMVRVGTRAPIDVTEAEATVASRKVDVIDAENLVKTAEDTLRRILNITPDSPLWHASIMPTDTPNYEKVNVNLEESIEAALAHRPELDEAQLNLKTLELTTRYERNQRLPQLDFAANYGMSGVSGEGLLPGPDGEYGTADDIYLNEGMFDSLKSITDRDYTNWNVGLSFSIPIRNRAAARRYLISKLNYDKADLQYQSLEQTITLEVKEAVRNIEIGMRRIEAATASRILSKERLNAVQKRFENGMATNFEVSEYQQYLASAETEEIRALLQYVTALLSLEDAKGNLLQSRGIVLESME